MDEQPQDQQSTSHYKVIGADGNTYGPVDLDTLKQWAADNRLKPDTQVINELTGVQTQARYIAGLFEGGDAAPRMQAPVVETPPAKKSNTVLVVALVLLFGCCGCGLILPAILFPVFAQSKEAAKRTAALSQMKELATGLAIYTSDYDDKFPIRMGSALEAQVALGAYATESSFRSLNPAGGEILGNRKLERKEVSAVTSPTSIITFYDERPWSNGKALAGYVDTHAKFEPSQSFVTDRLKLNPFAPAP